MSCTIYISINIESSAPMSKLVYSKNVKPTRKGYVTPIKALSYKEINAISNERVTYVRAEKECYLPFSSN